MQIDSAEPAKTKGKLPGRKRKKWRFLRPAQRDPSYIRKRLRELFQSRLPGTLAERCLDALWPWDVNAYPGRSRLRAWLQGCPVQVARQNARGDRLPRRCAERIAAVFRAKAAELLALAAECEAWAARPRKPDALDLTGRRRAARDSFAQPPSERFE